MVAVGIAYLLCTTRNRTAVRNGIRLKCAHYVRCDLCIGCTSCITALAHLQQTRVLQLCIWFLQYILFYIL